MYRTACQIKVIGTRGLNFEEIVPSLAIKIIEKLRR